MAKVKAPKEFTVTLVVSLKTDHDAMDPDAVIEAFREDIEAIDLWTNDTDHDEASQYKPVVISASQAALS